MAYNIPISEKEIERIHNRKRHTFEEFQTRLSGPQKKYLGVGNRTAKLEKSVRRREKNGMTAFTATLRHETTVRLNQVPKGLKSANLEVLISRGWLWGQMWDYIYDLSEELRIKTQQIDLLIERGGDE